MKLLGGWKREIGKQLLHILSHGALMFIGHCVNGNYCNRVLF